MENTEKLMLARIKQLEIDRDKIAADRDELLIKQNTVLGIYTEWLIGCDFFFPGSIEINHVEQFRKALEKKKKKLKTAKNYRDGKH